jgi:hypothetical protein
MKNKGSALVDYLIPTALVAVVFGLGLYTLVSNGSLLKFFAASIKMTVNDQKKSAYVGDKITALTYTGYTGVSGGDLGGTPTNPVKSCKDGNCIIDFGEFALSGIPEDFPVYVETAGTAGGTDKLLSLLDQLAQELEEIGDTQGAADLKKFSNQGHALAALETKMESIANSCANAGTDTEKRKCFTSAYTANSSYSDLQSELAAILEKPAKFSTLDAYTDSIRPDKAVYDTTIAKTKDLATCSASELGCAFYDQFNTISNNNLFSSNIKGIAKEVYVEISNLCSNISAIADAMGLTESTGAVAEFDYNCQMPPCWLTGNDICTCNKTIVSNADPNQVVYDPLTGQPTTKDFSSERSSTTGITNPKTSIGTHLDSKIVCIVGKNDDNGYKCK